MLKKAPSFVALMPSYPWIVACLFIGSTYRKGYASPHRSLRPRWMAFLNILTWHSGIVRACTPITYSWRTFVFQHPPSFLSPLPERSLVNTVPWVIHLRSRLLRMTGTRGFLRRQLD
jgi:hypothetical protein